MLSDNQVNFSEDIQEVLILLIRKTCDYTCTPLNLQFQTVVLFK
jgi:hypothetical protein